MDARQAREWGLSKSRPLKFWQWYKHELLVYCCICQAAVKSEIWNCVCTRHLLANPITNGNYFVIIFLPICSVCTAAVLTNHSSWRFANNYINCCVLPMEFMFDRNVWFVNCLYWIKRWVIGQYASGYVDCSLFPVLCIYPFGLLPSVSNPL